MSFIFTNVPVLHTTSLHLQVKKSLTFKDSPEPPLPMGISGLLDSWAEQVESPLPCDGGCFLFYQQRMSFSKRDFVLYHSDEMSGKYWMNLQLNPRRNDANVFLHPHLGPLETGYSRNPGLRLKESSNGQVSLYPCR